MPVLRTLDEEESEILLHLLENRKHSLSDQQRFSDTLTDSACSSAEKVKLAKISEEQRFAVKNRFKH